MVAPPPAAQTAEPKRQLTLSNHLGTLVVDPDDRKALAALRAIVAERDPQRLGDEPVRLLEMARQGHEQRGELATVAELIEIELPLVGDDRLLAASLLKELGRLRAEFLLDPDGARDAYDRALALRNDDPEILEARKRLEQSEGSWKKFAKRFIEEADAAADLSLKTSLLLRAACLTWEYRKKGKGKEADKLFKKALEIDPSNLKAALLYEQVLREREDWKSLGQHLLDSAEVVRDKQDRVNFYVRAARVFARKLGDKNRAAACFERVLDFDPSNDEALAYLSEHFTAAEQWDHLVGLYEDALRVPQKLEVEQGILLQIGMVHYRMRKKPAEAEPYFARLRKLDPTHPAVLEFYRSQLGESDPEQLVRVLADAQRVTPDQARKIELALEAARVAQAMGGTGERAIEAWKLVQRLDPQNAEAARTLKELYAKAEKWNALVDVLKAQVDATSDPDTKVELLRELAAVYRDHLRLDGMLINAYNAILRIAPSDRETVAALARKYEELGRWNDLINALVLDAELATQPEQKIELYLRVARLWIDRFSNHNQAASPLERVLELEPNNRSALSLLREIYEKKRAWKPLFEVLKKERAVASDPAVRAELTVKMAELAADRLHGYADAVVLWREVCEDERYGAAALDALEKLAEREKDWPTLADALELQVAREARADDKIRLLLKLGNLHAERLQDPAAAGRVYRRILEIDPRQGKALRSLRDSLLSTQAWDELESLYERAADFEGLVDVLSSEADRARDPQIKIDLSFRAARIFEEKIGERARAQRSYERVLTVDPHNARAAAALAPLYEQEEKWSRLSAALEVVLGGLEPSAIHARLELLGRLRTLAQEKLRDGEAAFAHALVAYRLAPGDPEQRAALEATAEVAQAFDRLVEAYRERAEAAPAEEALALHRRMAVLASERLGRSALAIEQWQKVLAADASDAEAITALDRLYRAQQLVTELHALLVHRLERTDDVAQRRDILKELAAIEEDKLRDSSAAAERHRALAEIEPSSPEVWAALDRLVSALGRHDELAQVLARRLELEGEKAVRLELGARLSALHLEHLAAPEAAVSVLASNLELDPEHGPSLQMLERLGGEGSEHTALVHPVLERAYERAGRFDRLAKLLGQRLPQVSDESELRRLRLRLAEISSGKLGDAMAAYATLEAAFLEEPSDSSLWERLAQAAEESRQHRALANAYARAIEAEGLAEADRVELALRAASIYDDVLGEPHEAEPFHKRVLAADPLADKSFLALKDIYTNQERWDDLQALYRKRIEETVDGDQKLELLLQLCFLFEEILERPDQAIEAYRAVLELQPDHGPSRRTLEKLYEQTGRHRELAELLRENLDQAEGYDQVDTRFRLGELYEHKLTEPAQAVEQYEGVLQLQPHHLRAQAALARLLSVESQRQRVAAILEPIYESQGAYADLTRVLEIQLSDCAEPEARATLLLRIGELYETRLRDSDAAFSAYARAVEADPGDRVAREALARVAAAREVYRRKRAAVLESAVDAVADRDVQIDLLLELAQLQQSYLDDEPAAERSYVRLLELGSERDDVVMTAAKALERIYQRQGDFVRLAKVLDRQAQIEIDATARELILSRLGELYEQKLGDTEAAIVAQQGRVELDAANVAALTALERLYERAGRSADLAQVLERRAELSQEPVVRRELCRRIAGIHEEKLGDAEGAIDAYRAMLDEFGHDRETLAALSRLYEAAGRSEELLEMLEAEAMLATEASDRAALRFRAGELLRTKLGDPARALEFYEGALEEEPGHLGALSALNEILRGDDFDLRRHAARIAAPRHEALGRFDDLIAIYELLAEDEDELEKVEALRKAAQVAERGAADLARAMGYVGRALRIAHSHEALPVLLSEFARLAEATGRHGEYVGCLREVAPQIFDLEQKTRVLRKVAEVARERLHDTPMARATLRLILDDFPDDAPTLDALIALDEEAGDYAALIGVLVRKTELASDTAERARLLSRQAEVYERGLDEPEKAIAALEELVVDTPLASAYAGLERLYQRVHRWADLAAMYERELEAGIGNAVELRFRLARTCRQHLGDVSAALDHLREAIARDSNHAESIALLEEILSEQGEHRAVAAEILEPGYLARMQWAKLTAVLRARIDAEPDLEERKQLLVRLARIYEEQLEDYEETFEIFARLFREDPRDEEVWEILTRLAKVGGQWGRLAKVLGEAFGQDAVVDETLAKLARYVGSLYAERVVNFVKAAEFYGKALEFDRDDTASFRALEDAYRRVSNHAALIALYERQAESAPNDAERAELLCKSARLYANELNDGDAAREAYRAVLDSDPDHEEAIAGYERLLEEAQAFSELAEHLRRRVEHALGRADELDLQHRLGELLWEKVGDESAAIDVFEAVMQRDPLMGPP